MSLWSNLLRRWLNPPAPDAATLCRHLRRDVGLDDAREHPAVADFIPDRNCFPSQTFYALQSYR